MGENYSQGPDKRRADTPPQSVSPDFVNRPHPDNTASAAAEDGAAGAVVRLPRPVRRAVCIERRSGTMKGGERYEFVVWRGGWLGAVGERNSFGAPTHEKALEYAQRLAEGGLPIIDLSGGGK